MQCRDQIYHTTALIVGDITSINNVGKHAPVHGNFEHPATTAVLGRKAIS